MFFHKSDTCGLIIGIKWPVGASDKSLGENMQCYGLSALWLQASSPGPPVLMSALLPPPLALPLIPVGSVCLNLSQLNKAQ